MKTPRAPAIIRKSSSARRAWRDLWSLLDEQGMAEDIYRPMVAALSMELGLAEDAANAVFRPVNPYTGKRAKRTLEEYLDGRNSQTAQELTLLRDSLRQVAKLAAEFGASPAARKRIGSVEKSETESPMMQYIRTSNEMRAKRSTG